MFEADASGAATAVGPCEVISAIAAADRADARAVAMINQVGTSAIAADAAMPADRAIALATRRPRKQVRELLGVAATMRQMPRAARLLAEGVIGYASAVAIHRAVRGLSGADRDGIDHLVAELAPGLAHAEPEALADQVWFQADLRRAGRADKDQDLAYRDRYLCLQAGLDGSGRLHGSLDPEGMAALGAALDAAAEAPTDPGAPGATPRSTQLADALVAVAEHSLACTTTTTRPRPRMLVSAQLEALQGRIGASQLLWDLAAGPVRLSPLSTEVAACDAQVLAVVFDGATPVGVSPPAAGVPDTVRRAVIARDGGCRGPDCSAPVSWCDIHHIRSKGGHGMDNLVLLCRRCHRMMHRVPWRITHLGDGRIEFRRGLRRYISVPRAGPLRT